MSRTVASPVARWALTAVKRSIHRVVGRRCKVDKESAVQSMDCTPLMEALVDKEMKLDAEVYGERARIKIQGVQRS